MHIFDLPRFFFSIVTVPCDCSSFYSCDAGSLLDLIGGDFLWTSSRASCSPLSQLGEILITKQKSHSYAFISICRFLFWRVFISSYATNTLNKLTKYINISLTPYCSGYLQTFSINLAHSSNFDPFSSDQL